MAVVRIPEENRSLHEQKDVRYYLASVGIDYERWELVADVTADASTEDILHAYKDQI